MNSLLELVPENGGKNFNNFLACQESKSCDHHDQRVIQIELKEKIIHFGNIDNVRFSRAGRFIINTKVVECDIDVCRFSEFSRV